MYFKLKYVEGAIPGKAGTKRKAQPQDQPETSEKRERKFNPKWQVGRDWLLHEDGLMKCKICIQYYEKKPTTHGQNKFIQGSTNMKTSAIADHEDSVAHKKAIEAVKAKSTPSTHSQAGKMLMALKQSERNRLIYLMRNTHAVIKNNRPLSDYKWLCDLDKSKGLDLGETYINDKAAVEFLKCIADGEKQKTTELIRSTPFFAILMDGSTDISGDEQEALYLRTSLKGRVTERFLCIGTPKSTCAEDLKTFVLDALNTAELEKGRLEMS